MTTPTTFIKHDEDSLDLTLVPSETDVAIAEVLTYGMKKYARDNWKKCTKKEIKRYHAALLRHITAWNMGEKIDPESGLSHLKHALTNLAIIQYLEEHKYKPKEPK